MEHPEPGAGNLPLTSALSTTGSMTHTAAVLSDPAFPFIQADWFGGVTVILLLAVIGLYKIFALDFGLGADQPQGGTFDVRMVRNDGVGYFCAAGQNKPLGAKRS